MGKQIVHHADEPKALRRFMRALLAAPRIEDPVRTAKSTAIDSMPNAACSIRQTRVTAALQQHLREADTP